VARRFQKCRPFVVLVAAAIAAGPQARADAEWGRGHIVLGGRWTTVRSTSVLLDRDSVDGFFLPAPAEGDVVRAVVSDNSGDGYVVAANFHTSANLVEALDLGPRSWIRGCSQQELDAGRCVVPHGAATVEITASRGRDLDVTVLCSGVCPKDI
jgi:hypothetical protein